MPLITVVKCQGTGNDFLLLDARGAPAARYETIAKTLCHRRFALGADGLLVLSDPKTPAANAAMRIFNADGSEAEMCGNGIRCVARYVYDENPERSVLAVETVAGLMETKIQSHNGRLGVRVSMGVPKVERELSVRGLRAPAYAVSMGNPHVVVFVDGDLADVSLEAVAVAAGSWGLFPSAPNVEVARVNGSEISMRVRERGVGETWACGTGACACAVAAIASGRARTPVTVATKGGSVRVAWEGAGEPALLTGDAELVYRAVVELDVDAGSVTIQR